MYKEKHAEYFYVEVCNNKSFLKWLEEKHNIQDSENDVYILNNGEVEIESKMCKKITITPDDYMEFIESE